MIQTILNIARAMFQDGKPRHRRYGRRTSLVSRLGDGYAGLTWNNGVVRIWRTMRRAVPTRMEIRTETLISQHGFGRLIQIAQH